VIASSFTIRGSIGQDSSSNPSPSTISPSSRKLPLGTAVQLQVTNNETSNLYLTVLVIDPTGEMSVIFPNQWTAADEVTLVAPTQTLRIPDASKDPFRLVTQEPKGIAEVLIIASQTPLRTALQALQALAAEQEQRRGPVELNQPAEVIDNLLDDINNGSRGNVDNAAPRDRSVRSIETTKLAALSITFEVI
jgi:hypothetical protein